MLGFVDDRSCDGSIMFVLGPNILGDSFQGIIKYISLLVVTTIENGALLPLNLAASCCDCSGPLPPPQPACDRPDWGPPYLVDERWGNVMFLTRDKFNNVEKTAICSKI